MSSTPTFTLATAVLSCLISLPALAQPTAPPPPPPDQPAGGPAGDDDRGTDLRDRLQHRLDELHQEQERLDKAMGMLDKGASKEDVLREIRPPGQEGDRPDPGERSRDRWRQRRDDGGPDGGPQGSDRPPQGPDGSDRPRESSRLDWRNPEQREQALAFMREKLPDVADRLDKLKQSNPAAADRLSARVGGRVMEIMDLQKRDPELSGLKLDELRNFWAILEAFKQAKQASDDKEHPEKLAAARSMLAECVAKQFDIRASLHKHEIDQLQQRLNKLQADLDAQRGKRDDTIKQRTDDILSGKEKMDLFGDGPGRGPGHGPPQGGRGRDDTDDHDRPDHSPGDQPPPK